MSNAINDQKQFSEEINAFLLRHAVSGNMSTAETAEMLIDIAVNLMDYNGGEADTRHAIKICHEFVENSASARGI
jgi:hypothetical protein